MIHADVQLTYFQLWEPTGDVTLALSILHTVVAVQPCVCTVCLHIEASILQPLHVMIKIVNIYRGGLQSGGRRLLLLV